MLRVDLAPFLPRMSTKLMWWSNLAIGNLVECSSASVIERALFGSRPARSHRIRCFNFCSNIVSIAIMW